MNPFTRNLKDPETGRWSSKEIGARVRSAFAVIVSVAVLGVGGVFVYNAANNAWVGLATANDYVGAGGAAVQVNIPNGSTLSSVGNILVQKGVIKSASTFNTALAAKNVTSLSAGTYKLKLKIPAATAVSMLLDHKNIVYNRMTLTEGQWLSTTIATMSKDSKIPVADFNKVLDKPDPAALGLPAWFATDAPKGATAEGFVFPDTYDLPTKPTAANVSKIPTQQFTKVAASIGLTDAAAKALSVKEGLKKPLTAYDIVIVASMIEREVNQPADRAKVAQVVYNRINAGMKLQLNSTAAYASKVTGTLGLTQKQLMIDSPYNTMVYAGLPVGPIANPGKAALQAALNPTAGNWLYFVVVNPKTGETGYGVTDADFANLKAQYQAWCNASADNKKLC